MSVTPDSLSPLVSKLLDAWDASSFVKLTLSSPEPLEDARPGGELRNLKARAVDLKEGRMLSLVECFPNREVTRNHASREGARLLDAQGSPVLTVAHRTSKAP